MKERKAVEPEKEFCHICGEPAVTRALIEGAKVPVCPECRSYGREIEQTQTSVRLAQLAGAGPKLPEYSVRPGYGETVKIAREKLKYTREALAKKLFINEGELSKIEGEKLAPSETVARKLERALSITLLEKATSEAAIYPSHRTESSGGVVLGEVADIK